MLAEERLEQVHVTGTCEHTSVASTTVLCMVQRHMASFASSAILVLFPYECLTNQLANLAKHIFKLFASYYSTD